MALALATALVVMLVTDTLHSPAGADPLIVIADNAFWGFLIDPVAISVATVFVGSLITNNIGAARR